MSLPSVIRFEIDGLVDLLFALDSESPSGSLVHMVESGQASVEDIIVHFGTRLVERLSRG